MPEVWSRLSDKTLLTRALAFCTAILLVGCAGGTKPPMEEGTGAATPFVVTKEVGRETADCPAAATCTGGDNVREVLCGEITADDGSVWALPGPTSDGATAVGIFNECTGAGHNPEYESELSTTVIDPEGVEITAHLFGDNYFELYANNEYLGRDAVGFTPFNSRVARFQVEYPVTYAALLVDWEGYLDLVVCRATVTSPPERGIDP